MGGSDRRRGPAGSRGRRSALLLAAAAMTVPLHPPAPAGESPDRPNVVLIMADDLGWEALGAYGGRAYETPRLDALAREGTTFQYCFSSPLCTPSRVMMMTGRYGHRNYRQFGQFPKEDEANTFGSLMRKAGYATCMAGKWHVKGVTARGMGFDRSLRCESWGGYWGLEGIWIDDRKVKPGEVGYAAPGGGPAYRPDVTCDFVLRFIEEHRERPFFVYYPMFLPHHPEQPTPDSPGKEAFLASGQADAAVPGVFPEMVRYLDGLVGRVVDRLEALGLRKKTLVLFTADNGTCVHSVELNGRKAGGGKGSMKDSGTRVPLIASWKGTTPAGAVCDDLVDFTDFYPTLAEAAGAPVEAARGVDGVSFFPRIAGRKDAPREWAFMHFRGRSAETDGGNWPDKAGSYWARDRRWKLYHDGRLFDLEDDPDERRPRGADGDTAETAAARRRLEGVFQRLQVTPGSIRTSGQDR